MAVDRLPAEALGPHVGGILRARPLLNAELPLLDALLDPQVGSGQMPDLAEAFTPNDANGSCGI